MRTLINSWSHLTQCSKSSSSFSVLTVHSHRRSGSGLRVFLGGTLVKMWNFLPEAWRKKFVRFLEENRGLVVLFVCLPASFIFDILLKVWSRATRFFSAGPESHHSRVKGIQSKVIE